MVETFNQEYDDYQESLEEKNQCRECGKEILQGVYYCDSSCLEASNI